jgi:hypothetical protein
MIVISQLQFLANLSPRLNHSCVLNGYRFCIRATWGLRPSSWSNYRLFFLNWLLVYNVPVFYTNGLCHPAVCCINVADRTHCGWYGVRWDNIIITWRYSPTWALAPCAIHLHWSLSSAFLLHPSIPISRRSSWTSSSHLTLGLPLFLLV